MALGGGEGHQGEFFRQHGEGFHVPCLVAFVNILGVGYAYQVADGVAHDGGVAFPVGGLFLEILCTQDFDQVRGYAGFFGDNQGLFGSFRFSCHETSVLNLFPFETSEQAKQHCQDGKGGMDDFYGDAPLEQVLLPEYLEPTQNEDQVAQAF